MKIFILILVMLITGLTINSLKAQGNWSLQTNPSTGRVVHVKAVSANEAWINLTNDQLLHTIDAGLNWDQVSPDVSTSFWSKEDAPGSQLSFINASTGWVVKCIGTSYTNNSQGVVVYKTTNSGAIWQKTIISQVAGDTGAQIQFIDESNGWLMILNTITYNTTYFKTIDGGANWISTSGKGIFHFVDANNGWTIDRGSGKVIYHTTNGGTTWTSQFTFTDPTIGELNAIQFTDLNNGWIIGNNGKIFKTSNGGINWAPVTNTGITSQHRNTCIYFMNAATGWIGTHANGQNVFVLHTTDGGISWSSQQAPAGSDLKSISYWDENNGWHTSNLNEIGHYNFAPPVTSNWTLQTNPVSTSADLGKIQFVSATEGWISISPGGLLHTTNGGATWTEVTSPFKNDIVWSIIDPAVNMSFISTTTGWIMKSFGTDFPDSHGAVVYKTTDGGGNWQKTILTQNAGDIGAQIQFINANIGWASYGNQEGNYTLLKTTNGGTTWNPILTSASSIPFFFFHFIDSNNGWASSADMDVIGQTGRIYNTTDGGVNWTLQFSDTTILAFSPIAFTDLNHGWLVGENGKILKTDNGGADWTPVTIAGITSDYTCKSVYFMNATTGWIGAQLENTNNKISASSNDTKILHTTDGGASWTIQTTPTFNPYSIFFWDANNGWLTSEDNQIAHYSDALGVKENLVNKFITIYPNPNNGTFYFSLKETNSKVKAEIFNLSGQKVYEAFNFEMGPQNQVNFAPQATGIYLIKITNGENSYSEKIMIK